MFLVDVFHKIIFIYLRNTETKHSEVEDAFKRFSSANDIGIILITQAVIENRIIIIIIIIFFKKKRFFLKSIFSFNV